MLCENFDGETTEIKLPMRLVRDNLRMRSEYKTSNYLVTTGYISGIKVTKLDNYYIFDARILLELKSRDFKKARSKRGGAVPKNKIKIKNNIYRSSNDDRVFRLTESMIDEVYKIYPRKMGKARGYKKLLSSIRSRESYDDLLKAVKNYHDYAKGRDKQYIPHFSTWVNETWRDFINYTEIEKTDYREALEYLSQFETQVD